MKLTSKHVAIVAIVCITAYMITYQVLRYKLTIRAGEFVYPVKVTPKK